MGADPQREWPRLRELLARAEQLSGRDIAGPMFGGPPQRLHNTVVTQLAIFTLSVSLAELLAAKGLRPAVVAGHSLGEYAALVTAGWLEVDDALAAVAERAAAMDDCCASHDGAMTAVLGLAPDALEQLCADVEGVAVLANRNSPKQSVVAGEPASVHRLVQSALSGGARAAIPLPVSGAFHSPLMAAAEQRLAPVIAQLPLRIGEVPFVSSITGELVDDVEDYRRSLAGQITAPVRWDRVMTTLQSCNIDAFVEVGPGRAIRGLLRHVDRGIVSHGCDSIGACQELTGRRAA